MNWLNVKKNSTLMEPQDPDLNLMRHLADNIHYPTEQSDRLLITLPVFCSLLEAKRDGNIDFGQTRVVVSYEISRYEMHVVF